MWLILTQALCGYVLQLRPSDVDQSVLCERLLPLVHFAFHIQTGEVQECVCFWM